MFRQSGVSHGGLMSNSLTPSVSGHMGPITALIKISDNCLMSSAEDQTICIWQIIEGEVRLNNTINTPIVVKSLALLKDTQQVACAGTSNHIHILNLETKQFENELKGHADYIHTLAVLRDGILISVAFDKVILVWDIASKTLKNTVTFSTDITSLIVSDNQYIAIGLADGSLQLLTITPIRYQFNLINKFKEHTQRIITLATYNNKIASASHDGTICLYGAICLWEMKAQTHKLSKRLKCNVNVSALVFLNDEYLVSASDDKTLRLWNINSLTCIEEQTSAVSSGNILVALSGGRLVVDNFDNTIRLRNTLLKLKPIKPSVDDSLSINTKSGSYISELCHTHGESEGLIQDLHNTRLLWKNKTREAIFEIYNTYLQRYPNDHEYILLDQSEYCSYLAEIYKNQAENLGKKRQNSMLSNNVVSTFSSSSSDRHAQKNTANSDNPRFCSWKRSEQA